MPLFSQSKRFENLSYLAGATLFLAFLKFPVIRIQPGFQRVGIAGVMAFPFYSYVNGLATKLKVKRSNLSFIIVVKYIYRKTVTEHGAHERITM